MSQNSKPQAGDRVRVIPLAIRIAGTETPAKIRDPNSGEVLPPEGVVTKHSSFWDRRAAEGAVRIELAPPTNASTAAPPTA